MIPLVTGSLTMPNTIGIVRVARTAATAPGVDETTITSMPIAIISWTSEGSLALSPSAHRYSKRTLCPSTQPSASMPSTNARTVDWSTAAVPLRASKQETLPLPEHRDAYYDGAWHAPKSGRYVDVLNPGTGASLGRIADESARAEVFDKQKRNALAHTEWNSAGSEMRRESLQIAGGAAGWKSVLSA